MCDFELFRARYCEKLFVCPSARHIRYPRLNGSRYRNVSHIYDRVMGCLELLEIKFRISEFRIIPRTSV